MKSIGSPKSIKAREPRLDDDICIIPNELYNLSTSVGTFKIKRTPWNIRYPNFVFDGTKDGRVLRWCYMPWQRFRVSPGDGEYYIGGYSVKNAFNNMVHHYGGSRVVILGRGNQKYFNKTSHDH